MALVAERHLLISSHLIRQATARTGAHRTLCTASQEPVPLPSRASRPNSSSGTLFGLVEKESFVLPGPSTASREGQGRKPQWLPHSPGTLSRGRSRVG